MMYHTIYQIVSTAEDCKVPAFVPYVLLLFQCKTYDCVEEFWKNKPGRQISVKYEPYAADWTDSGTEAALRAPESEDELDFATLGIGSNELELDDLELETLKLSSAATSSKGSALSLAMFDMAFLESSSQSD
jgi:hypothetical protein